MKYIDFSVQSIFFVAALILLAPIGGSDVLLMVLNVQLLVAGWQLVSCVISVGLHSAQYKRKTIHLVLSIVYLTILFVFPVWEFPETWITAFLLVPSWALAIYYYVLTILGTFRKPARQSGFLPHTSF